MNSLVYIVLTIMIALMIVLVAFLYGISMHGYLSVLGIWSKYIPFGTMGIFNIIGLYHIY